MFYEAATTVSDLTSAEECRPSSADTSGEGSSECGTDCSRVLEGQIEEVKTLVLSPLDQLSPRQRSRRTQALMSLLQEEAEENSITTSQLLGYLLHRENYVKDRALTAVGMQVFSNKPVGKELSLDEGLYILSQYKLGHTSYTSLRHDLKPRVELPAHYKLMQHKNAIMPTIAQLSELPGVILSLTKSVVVHFERLVKLLQLQSGSYIMKAKEGLDGSGRHSVYNQQGSFESHNMIIWMWVPLQLAKDSSDVAMIDELTCSTSSTGSSEIVWKEGAPSSPEAARPILLAVGKEDKDLLNMLIPPVDAEICSLQSKGVKVVVSDQEYSLGIEFFRSMNDGKMQKLLLGRGGAFCVFCSYSACLAEQIVEGFEIGDVDINSLKALYEDLEVDGVVQSYRGDYNFRHGLTQNPITSFSVKTFPILHALLRGLDYCLKLVYKLNAKVNVWKENKQISVMIKAAKKRVQEIIKAKTGLSVDKPDPVGAGGTSTTGNMARKLLFDPSKRQVLV